MSFFQELSGNGKVGYLSALPKQPVQQSTRAESPFPSSEVSLKKHHEFKTRKLLFEELKTLAKQIVSPNGMFKQARYFQSVTVQNRISLYACVCDAKYKLLKCLADYRSLSRRDFVRYY